MDNRRDGAKKGSADATIMIRGAGTNHSMLTGSSGSDEATATLTMQCQNRLGTPATTGALFKTSLSRTHATGVVDQLLQVHKGAVEGCFKGAMGLTCPLLFRLVSPSCSPAARGYLSLRKTMILTTMSSPTKHRLLIEQLVTYWVFLSDLYAHDGHGEGHYKSVARAGIVSGHLYQDSSFISLRIPVHPSESPT
jgi:hypothetical protein